METRSKRQPWWSAEVAADIQNDHRSEAIERLVALMHSKNENVAIRAAEALLDRGYGRPMQGMEVSGQEVSPKRTVIRVAFVASPKRMTTIPCQSTLP